MEVTAMHRKLIGAALTAGAAKAAVIPGEKIITSGEFRRACEVCAKAEGLPVRWLPPSMRPASTKA